MNLSHPLVLPAVALVVAGLLLWVLRRRVAPVQLSLSDLAGNAVYHIRLSVDETLDAAVRKPLSPVVASRPLVVARSKLPTRILIDSVMLVNAFRYLTGHHLREANNGSFVESFHWAAGIMVEKGVFAVTQLVPVALASQTPVSAVAGESSSIQALAALEQFHLTAICHFHIHPGRGRGANRPSAVDLRFQRGLEKAGSPAIGGIFSRDGYCRFFSSDLDTFVVEVTGNGARKVGDNEFEIQLEKADFPSELLVFRAPARRD